jgi:hypothetical protein
MAELIINQIAAGAPAAEQFRVAPGPNSRSAGCSVRIVVCVTYGLGAFFSPRVLGSLRLVCDLFDNVKVALELVSICEYVRYTMGHTSARIAMAMRGSERVQLN